MINKLPTSREADISGPRVRRGGQPIKSEPLSRFRALFIYSIPKAILMRLDWRLRYDLTCLGKCPTVLT